MLRIALNCLSNGPREARSSPFGSTHLHAVSNSKAETLDSPLTFPGAAVQIHYFARIMLAVHSPVVSGLKELERLQQTLNDAINYIGGVACTTTNTAATIISTQCLFAAGLNTRDLAKRDQIVQLLRAHQSCTGWPVHDLARDLQVEWAVEASPMTVGT